MEWKRELKWGRRNHLLQWWEVRARLRRVRILRRRCNDILGGREDAVMMTLWWHMIIFTPLYVLPCIRSEVRAADSVKNRDGRSVRSGQDRVLMSTTTNVLQRLQVHYCAPTLGVFLGSMTSFLDGYFITRVSKPRINPITMDMDLQLQTSTETDGDGSWDDMYFGASLTTKTWEIGV
jgi:hypothetical protein